MQCIARLRDGSALSCLKNMDKDSGDEVLAACAMNIDDFSVTLWEKKTGCSHSVVRYLSVSPMRCQQKDDLHMMISSFLSLPIGTEATWFCR